MEQVTCSSCGGANEAGSSFCRHCGAAIAPPASTSPDGAAPSGWAMATSGMAQPAPMPAPGTGAIQREQLAGWWHRLGAWMLDGLILGMIALVILLIVGGIAWATNGDAIVDWFDSLESSSTAADPYADGETLPDVFWAFYGLFIICGLVLTLTWETLWVSGTSQGTPGMLVCGFRVTDDSGNRISRKRAFGRACAKLVYSVPYIGVFLQIATAFTIGISQKRQALHDMMAGTICVSKRALEVREQLASGAFAPPVAAGTPGMPPQPPLTGQPIVPPHAAPPPQLPPQSPPPHQGPFA